MKKLILSLFMCIPLIAHAYDALVDGIYYEFSDNNAIVTYGNYNTYSGKVNIPSSVYYAGEYYKVTSIGGYAFADCSDLTSVTIPNSVTSIESYAFSGCSNLFSVTIPNSVTNIGSDAFPGIKNILYSGTATGAPWGANCLNGYVDGDFVYKDASKRELSGCSTRAFGRITVPNSVTSIGSSAFENCLELTSVTVPNSVNSIGNKAFAGCWALTSVNIPNSLKRIGEYVFSGCRKLTSITIPSSVTSIGEYAFCACGLTSVKIPESVTDIGVEAFSYCSSLTSVTIPNSVMRIGHDAFTGCYKLPQSNDIRYADSYAIEVTRKALKTYSLKEGTRFIGSSLFKDCTGLSSFVIPNSVVGIGESSFSGCKALTSVTIPNSVTCIDSSTFEGCKALTSVNIPNSVVSIGESAFSGCSGLRSVTIPNSVVSIGESAFSGCSGLRSVTIPNSVVSIGESAFSGCSGLRSVTIPNSVNSIGPDAFAGCYDIVVRIDDIGNWCNIKFSNLNSNPLSLNGGLLYLNGQKVTNLNIPNTVVSIGKATFYNCNELVSVTIPNSVKRIEESAFWGCTSLASVNIPGSVTSIGESAFYDCYGLGTVTIPNSVTSIGAGAFSLVKNIEYSGVAKGGPWGANSLNGYIDGNLIYKDATKHDLLGCFTAAEGEINIPNSVTNIGACSFYSCTGVTSVTIPNSVTNIGAGSFYDCTSLSSVAISNSVATIERQTFDGCRELKSITIPNSVTTISRDAFNGCPLKEITCLAVTPPDVSYYSFMEHTYDEATLKVLVNSINAYKSHQVWKRFVIANVPNGIDMLKDDCRDIIAYSSNGVITIKGLDENETVRFYTVGSLYLGQSKAQAGVVTFSTSASGIIIAKIGNGNIRIMRK